MIMAKDVFSNLNNQHPQQLQQRRWWWWRQHQHEQQQRPKAVLPNAIAKGGNAMIRRDTRSMCSSSSRTMTPLHDSPKGEVDNGDDGANEEEVRRSLRTCSLTELRYVADRLGIDERRRRRIVARWN